MIGQLEYGPKIVENLVSLGPRKYHICYIYIINIINMKLRLISIGHFVRGHRQFLMGGSWSATRFSVFFLIKIDGTLDVWDLLIQQDSPVLSIKVTPFFILIVINFNIHSIILIIRYATMLLLV